MSAGETIIYMVLKSKKYKINKGLHMNCCENLEIYKASQSFLLVFNILKLNGIYQKGERKDGEDQSAL